jgi:hypothetical protein
MRMGRSGSWLAAMAALACWAGPVDLGGKAQDPFSGVARARVLLFVRSDCPITNRYAPELARIAAEFKERGVAFWLIYPDAAETPSAIEKHVKEYRLPGTPLRDPQHELVKRAQATVSPQAAVFDDSGKLKYTGRIDDRYVSFGTARPAARTHDLEAAITAVLERKPMSATKTRAIGCYLADVQ